MYSAHSGIFFQGEQRIRSCDLQDSSERYSETTEHGMEPYFADYPLRLFCVNDADSFEMFHTELRELFSAMKYRKDREKLQELFTHDDHYSHLTPDTAEALSVFLSIPSIWKNWEQYRNRTGESEEYNMCQAIEEMKEDNFTRGISQGIEIGALEKTRIIVQNMLKHGFSDREICEMAECTSAFIDELR